MDELIVRLDTYGGSFRRGALTRSASAVGLPGRPRNAAD
jgi:hypothetical protein